MEITESYQVCWVGLWLKSRPSSARDSFWALLEFCIQQTNKTKFSEMPSRVFKGYRPICLFTIGGLFCLFVHCLVDWLVFETGPSYAALPCLALLDSQDWLGIHRGKLASDFWVTGLKVCTPMIRITFFFFYTNHTQYLVILLK